MSSDINKDFKVLIVDDDSDVLELLEETVSELGFDVLTCDDPAKALPIVRKNKRSIAMIISDYKMPEMNGLEFREMILADYKDIPFAILSGHVTREMALTGVENKICAFMEKPFTTDLIHSTVQKESKDRIAAIQEENELRQGFFEEAATLMEELEPLIMELESNPSDHDTVDRIFAILHTIKGVSGFFQPDTVHRFAHKFEDFLSRIRNGSLSASPEAVSVMLQALDTLKDTIESLKADDDRAFDFKKITAIFDFDGKNQKSGAVGTPADAPSQAASPRAKSEKAEIRVTSELLDEFMSMSGEITVLRNMINKIVKSLEKSMAGNKDVLLLSDLLEELHRINGNMQDRVIDLRKVPLRKICRPLARSVRDLSLKLKKNIKFDVKGDSLRVDTSIAEILNNSLIHMVRNCVDHGIESAEKRIASGKPETGHITLSAREEKEDVIIELKDDGGGIDYDRVWKKAIENGLKTQEELEEMSESEVFGLIFEPGFSTAETITDVSGRGVGTDMVKKSIEKIEGDIVVNSESGAGTHFTLRLPIPKSVVIISSLFVKVSDRIFAISQDDISRLISIDFSQEDSPILELRGSRFIELAGELIPIVSLTDTLGLQPTKRGDTLNMVVIKSKIGKYCLEVDEISDVEDTVVKKLNQSFRDLNVFSGATFIGDGLLGLILDVVGVAERAGVGSQTAVTSGGSKDSAKQDSVVMESPRDYLMFELSSEGRFGIRMEDLFRLEEVRGSDIQYIGDIRAVRYRGSVLPILHLEGLMGLEVPYHAPKESHSVLVVQLKGGYVGLEVRNIIDLMSTTTPVSSECADRAEILGNLIVNERTYNIVDVEKVLDSAARTMNVDSQLNGEANFQAAS